MTNVVHTFKYPNYIVAWDPATTNVYCYGSFLITLSADHQDLFVVHGYEFIFSGWLDWLEYTLEITAMYDNEHKSQPVQHIISTPGGVKNLTIRENDKGTAEIEWVLPANLDHALLEYEITVNGENYTTGHSHISLSVEFCVDLEIVLTVKYSTGVLRSASFNKRLMKVPGQVRNLRIAVVSEVIHIHWEAPNLYSHCVNAYTLNMQGDSVVVDNQKTRFEVANWEPCTLLNVKVAAVNTDGITGEFVAKAIDTPVVEISPVKNLLVETTEKTLRLNWDEPLTAARCVAAYRVVVWDTDSLEIIYHIENETMFLVLEEMKACQKLTVQVTPIGPKAAEGKLIQRETEIKERVPGILSPLQTIEAHSRYLELRTIFNDNSYLCRLQLLKVTCQTSNNLTRTQTKDLNSMVPVTEQAFEIMVQDLEPYEQYTCAARLQTISGSWSNPSFDVAIQTLEDSKSFYEQLAPLRNERPLYSNYFSRWASQKAERREQST